MDNSIIKGIRKKRGIKAKDFALLLSITPVYLSRIENNKKHITLNILNKIRHRVPEIKLREYLLLKEATHFTIKHLEKHTQYLLKQLFYNINHNPQAIQDLPERLISIIESLRDENDINKIDLQL